MEALEYLLAFVFNGAVLSQYGMRLLQGLGMTAKVVALSVGIGFLLAFPLCRARMSRRPWLALPALGYVTLFRGTPLLCQLYIVYYGAGELRPLVSEAGLWWFFRDAFYCCVFAFSLNTAAYQAEILRGALRAVPRGQREAAQALGLSPWHAARHVVWPQAALIALRPLGNELVSIVKASALTAIVTVLDLMGQTRFVFARTFDFSVYFYAAVLYLMVTETIRRLWNRAERRLSRHLPFEDESGAARDAVPATGLPGNIVAVH
jgi:polar amino acid transport system permease protein